MKPLVIVSFHYPPAAAVGGIRPAKIAKFLSELGWSVMVITSRPPGTAHEPGRVYRVPARRNPLTLYEGVRARRHAGRTAAPPSAAWGQAAFDEAMVPSRGWRGAVLPWFRLPDEHALWVLPAAVQTWRCVRAYPGAVLLTTGPPFSCHLVGLLVKRLTGVPWVADFRDPWRLPDKYAAHRNAATDALEARWIRAVARRADRITSVTDRMTIQMRQDHPDVPPSKIVTLTSGFDRDDVAGLDDVRPPAPPVIMSYLGTFYHGRSPEPFLRGLKALLDEEALRRDEIAVRFIGHVATAEGRPVDHMIRQMGLEGVVTLTGPVSRREALQRSMQSHVVLILDEKHPAQIPYKLYEGMVTGALIFNIGSEGAVRDVLMKTQTGVACRYDDPEAIKRGILECCERVRAGWHSPAAARSRTAMVRDYDFRSITAQFSRYLSECS